MTRHVAKLLVALGAATFACSGAEKSKTTEAAIESGGAVEEAPPDQGDGIAWENKSEEQRKAYMKLTVTPRMAALFAEYDPEKYAEVKCTTCHGEGAREGKFEMPNAELPKLDDWEKLEAEEPQMMEFMKTKVVPEMAALLGQPPFDPETKTGFGCSGCHTR